MELKQAKREQVKLKIGLSGASGFGKTYSALLLAYGITNDYSKVAVIDTENESASLYSHLGNYNTLNLAPPYSPENYIEAIKVCVFKTFLFFFRYSCILPNCVFPLFTLGFTLNSI